MEKTEELIMCVRRHRCLYDPSDKGYKNYKEKCLLWEQIAKQLNETSESVKIKWKNLRDGYTKYKKLLRHTSGRKKKYQNWVWGPYLKFLDASATVNTISDDNRMTDGSLRVSTTTFNQHGLISADDHLDSERLSSPGSTSTTQASRQCTDSWYVQPPDASPMSTLSIKTDKDTDNNHDVDKVLSYLHNKTKNDSVHLLFSSYAESFKRFNPRTQAEIKIKLAQIFAEAEVREFDGSPAFQAPCAMLGGASPNVPQACAEFKHRPTRSFT